MAALNVRVFAVVIFEGDLRLFLNKIRPTPLEPPCHPAPRFGPFFGLVRGSRAAVAPQGGQGAWVAPKTDMRISSSRDESDACYSGLLII